MLWSIAAALMGAGVWWRADPESARATIGRALEALRQAARWLIKGDAMPRRLLALLALIFVLRWLVVFSHFGVTDGLRVMTGEGLESDEDTCHAHQRTVHATLIRRQARSKDAAGQRGHRVSTRLRCHSTQRALVYDIWGRLACRMHGRVEDLPPVLP